MSHDVWDLSFTNVLFDNLAKLEASLLGIDSMWVESTFSIKENSKELIGLFNSNDIHLTEWESVISSDFSINFDETFFLFTDLHAFLSCECVLKSLLQQNADWDAFSELMWSRGWSGSMYSFEFSKIPVLGSRNSFHNLSLTFIALKTKNRLALG